MPLERMAKSLDSLVELRTDKISGGKDPRLPYIGLEHIQSSTGFLNGTAPSSTSVSSNNVFRRGDILFGKLRPNLRKCVQVFFDGYCSTDILVLRAKPGIEPRYAFRLLQSDPVFRFAEMTAIGTRMPRTFWSDLRASSVYVPPLTEQRRIAEILDTVDEAIQQTEEVIAKLKQIKTGLLHDLLTRGIDEHGQLRDPIAHPDQFKDSPLGRIPQEWTVSECEDVCSQITVGIVVKPTQYYEPSGVPVLRSANVRESGIDGSDLVFMSEASNLLNSKSMLRSGDVLTVRTGYPGTSCVVPEEYDGANCVDILISRPSDQIDPQFLSSWINSGFGKGQVLRRQGGLAQQHFNVGELRQLLVPVPSGVEQHMIRERLKSLARYEESEAKYRAKLQLLKRGLMRDLLTGRVRTDVAEQVVA